MNTNRSEAPAGRAPLIMFGLDALEVDLLHRWIEEGRLPFLASLIDRGTFVPVRSAAFADAPWPSMFSGTTPGRHGFFSHLCVPRGTYRIERTDARWVRRPPFWSRLRGTGLRAAVFDVPKTVPVEGVEGLQVSGWGEHYPLLRQPESIPPSLAGELTSRFGRYRRVDEAIVPPSRRWERRTARHFLENIEKRTRAAEHLLDAGPWDFFFSVFAEIHYADHQFLYLCDETHWAFEPDAPADLRTALADVAAATDAALARLFARVPADANLIVLSVHGIEPNYSANWMVTPFLERLGLLVPAAARPPEGLLGRLLYRTRAVRKLIPRQVRDFINHRLLPGEVHDRAMSDAFAASAEWTRTQVFMLPNDHFQAFLSLNLKGREPQGIVNPGAEERALFERVRREFMRLIDADTNTAAVASVEWVPDRHAGECVRDLPDIVVHWSHDAPLRRLTHPEAGGFEGPPEPLRRSQHTPRGFLIGVGPAFRAGVRTRELDTVEIAPTLLTLLGLPPDPGMEAAPALDVLNPAVLPTALTAASSLS